MPISGLDQLISHLGTTPDPSKYWTVQNILRGNSNLQVTFQPIFGYQTVGASVRLFLGWKRPASEMGILSEPIKPPPGYEGVSMDPPTRDLSTEPFPKHGPDYYRELAARAKMKSGEHSPDTPVTEDVRSVGSPPAQALPTSVSVARRVPVWVWAIGIAALVLIALFVWMRRS